jgi:threonine aldolase
VFGGGMRQAGFIAAAGLYALKNNVLRLKEDHNGAKRIEKKLLEMPWVEHVLEVETNIVVCILKDSSRVNEFVNKFEANNILIMPFGKGMLRMVTHLDVSQNDILEVCAFIESLE